MKNTILLLSASLIILTGCGDKRSSRSEVQDPQEIQYAMPQGKMHFEGHGDEQWFAYTAITGTDDTRANGVAQSHMFEDGQFLHSINLNIEAAEDGYFYEGWIVNGPSVISTGHLSNYFSDSRHSLKFESTNDFTKNLHVIVTLERDDGNPAPDVHVAEGVLRVTDR